MSEYLLTGITITIAASIVAGSSAGVVKGIYGIHSGSTLRALAVCENVWVVVVIGAQVTLVYFAYQSFGLKDATLFGLVFLLTLPSLSWIYSRSDALAAGMIERQSGPVD